MLFRSPRPFYDQQPARTLRKLSPFARDDKPGCDPYRQPHSRPASTGRFDRIGLLQAIESRCQLRHLPRPPRAGFIGSNPLRNDLPFLPQRERRHALHRLDTLWLYRMPHAAPRCNSRHDYDRSLDSHNPRPAVQSRSGSARGELARRAWRLSWFPSEMHVPARKS